MAIKVDFFVPPWSDRLFCQVKNELIDELETIFANIPHASPLEPSTRFESKTMSSIAGLLVDEVWLSR
jgi:hypothetical protein